MKNNHTQAINSIEIARQTAMPFYFLLTAIIILVSLLTPHRAQGATGDLDPRFGNGGVAITDFAQTEDYAYAVAVQADGKIVVSGQSGVYPNLHSALVRYNRSGRLDSTFGTGGKVTVTFNSVSDYLFALALQSDGKIVAAGSTSGTAFLLARFNADGSLDQGFGNNGSVETTFGDQTAAASAIVVQADGKIIVVGVSGAGPYSELNDFALARYNEDLTLDATFNATGTVLTPFLTRFGSGSATAQAVAIQSDGRIIAAGWFDDGNRKGPDFALARYNADGTSDRTFNSTGKVVTDIGGFDIAYGVDIQPDGNIVAAGFSDVKGTSDFALARYLP